LIDNSVDLLKNKNFDDDSMFSCMTDTTNYEVSHYLMDLRALFTAEKIQKFINDNRKLSKFSNLVNNSEDRLTKFILWANGLNEE
jgi:hypothetical protein